MALATMAGVAPLAAALGLASRHTLVELRRQVVLLVLAAGLAAASVIILPDIPLQRFDAVQLVRLGVFVVASLFPFAVGLHSPLVRLTLATLLVTAALFLPLTTLLKVIVVIGVATLTTAGFVLPRHHDRLSMIVVFSWALLTVACVRPVLFEIVAWSMYRERLTVIPFQR